MDQVQFIDAFSTQEGVYQATFDITRYTKIVEYAKKQTPLYNNARVRS